MKHLQKEEETRSENTVTAARLPLSMRSTACRFRGSSDIGGSSALLFRGRSLTTEIALRRALSAAASRAFYTNDEGHARRGIQMRRQRRERRATREPSCPVSCVPQRLHKRLAQASFDDRAQLDPNVPKLRSCLPCDVQVHFLI